MSARVYFMKRVKYCKDLSIMSPQDEQWRRTSLLCLYTAVYTTVCSLNINKQNVNIADETLTDYSFLSRHHYTKSKNYLKRRYRIRHWIPMFIETPCTISSTLCHPPCKYGNARFKTVFFKALFEQVCIRYLCL